MKRWLFLFVACTCGLWGCTDETSPDSTTSTTSSTTTSSSSTTSSTTGSGGAGGEGGGTTSSTTGSGGSGGEGGAPPTDLVACLDMYDALPMPPNGTLPCEYIPPGLVLPQ